MVKAKRPGDKYRPSNSDEGINFQDYYCAKCRHDDPLATPEKYCPIITLSMGFDTSDPEYPKEWTYTTEGKPTCAAFEAELTPEEERQKRLQAENKRRESQGQLTLFELQGIEA